jgi:HAD superfamily hydrolase (TIGR01509 family)
VSPVELVIFDCDGVLVDSERISVRVGTQVLAELGWHLTEREFAERFVGCSAEHFHSEVSAGLGRQLEEGWEEPYAPRYRQAFEAQLRPVDGVADVLRVLDAQGVAFCVASNSDHEHIERVVRIAGLSQQVAGRVFSAQDVGAGKPEPDLFLHAARTMGVDPQHCAVVEDSPFGVRAAIAAGMDCYAYAGGMTPPHKLSGLGAVLFDEMTQLPGLLGLCPSPPPRSDIPSEVH